jgi:3'-5' exoribonuclease
MVLSHHGKLEFGSPKVPVFPEALLLHYLDDMDSKMECMRALIEKDPQAEGLFTGYSQSLERVALRKSRYLTGSEPTSTTATTLPGSAAVLPQPESQPAPMPGSLFGARLLQALNDERN